MQLLTLLPLLAFAADDTTTDKPGEDEPKVEVPDWGIYDDKTAESYDHEQHSMVWFSISGYKPADQANVENNYRETMVQLKQMIAKEFPDKTYHLVFFDSETYADHAKEGLNCTDLANKSCISVIQAIKNTNETEMPDENVYTKEIDDKVLHDKGPEAEKQRNEFFEFVKLIETGKEEEKKKYEHKPSFDSIDDSADADGPEGEDDSEDGFGDDKDEEDDDNKEM